MQETFDFIQFRKAGFDTITEIKFYKRTSSYIGGYKQNIKVTMKSRGEYASFWWDKAGKFGARRH